MRVLTVPYRPGRRPAGAPACRPPGAGVDDTTQRPHEEHDVVAELVRAGHVLDPAGTAALTDRTTVAVEQPLQHGQAHVDRVDQILNRDELGPRVRTLQAHAPQCD